MKVQGRIFTISNVLSFSRIIIVWPILIYLSKGTNEGNWIAFWLMIIGASTDFFDGLLARALNQQSDVGRIIDPLADKIGLGLIGIILTQTSGLPIWFLILIIARDLIILLLGSQIIKKSEKIPESNWYGKTAVGGIAAVVLFYTLQVSPWMLISLYTTVVLLLLSILSYLKVYLNFIRTQSTS